MRKVLNEAIAAGRAMRFIYDDLPLAGMMACDSKVLQAIEALNNAADSIRIAGLACEVENARVREEQNNDVQ